MTQLVLDTSREYLRLLTKAVCPTCGGTCSRCGGRGLYFDPSDGTGKPEPCYQFRCVSSCSACAKTGLRNQQLQRECEGYAFYGHTALPVEDPTDLDQYSVLNNAHQNNKTVVTLVREALKRDDPLDDWLWEALNAVSLGDTATREIAYSVVQTNIPHPPCQGSGYVPIPDVEVPGALLEIAKQWPKHEFMLIAQAYWVGGIEEMASKLAEIQGRARDE